MKEKLKKISTEQLTEIYEALYLPRAIEEKMLSLLRQNKISKWFSGIGQEAISVGVGLSVDRDDFLLPMHRNLGLFTTRGVPLYPLFCQLLGKADGFSGGRERSFHFGALDYKIVGMISHLAATMPIADGLALAQKLKRTDQIVVSFCGDGATSEGDFHESLNLAAVWKLPVIFMIENNGYGLSTPVSEQFACKSLADRAAGYGMKGMKIDGNNIFEVMEAVHEAREMALKGKPVFIEAMTFRMRGHEEASGTFYVSDEQIEAWKAKDPLQRVESRLLESGFMKDKNNLNRIRKKVQSEFTEELEKALEARDPVLNTDKELSRAGLVKYHETVKTEPQGVQIKRRFIDGIRTALYQAFDEDSTLIMMGQDIAEYGGVFKVTEGFLEAFGKDRIRNTPIIESGIIGTAIGLSLEGFKPVVEMQFADFISCGYNQIVNNLSKGHYRWMPPLNVTIRAPHGAGVGAGPFHSQSPEGWFMSHPGLRILVPGTVDDAQNMLYSSLFDSNPTLFFEHKKLYRSLKEEIPGRCRFVDLDHAVVRRPGRDVSIITYGLGLQWAQEIAEEYEKSGVSLEIVDLRTLAPLDRNTLRKSVEKTSKVLLLQEPSQTLGPMSELSAIIMEECFEFLDAPVIRCSSLDTPVPFNRELEKGFLARYRLHEKLDTLLEY
ncbi:MAG: thiamine pyrophosphate-dependent enzyme [Balneolaceae bacterium]